jgi:serine/threonine protein kinase
MSNPQMPAGATLKNNRYTILQHLKSGGFGAVYLATDAVFNARPCVIKESFGQSQDEIAQFEQEAAILFTLRHPNLVQVTDQFREAGQTQYLVMEYIDGEDLEEVMKRSAGSLPESSVLTWTEQVLDALGYCHTFISPVIHRDIKPSNIRIRRSDGRAILVDFGIAKIGDQSRATHKGAHAASDGYSPLEQYALTSTGPHQTGTGPYSDIYALGATLYHLLTGIEPPAAPAIQAGAATLNPPRMYNGAISAQMERVIVTAMQTRIQDRYQTADEMRLDLRGRLPTALCPHCGAAVRKSARYCPICSLIQTVTPLAFPAAKTQVSTVAELVQACAQHWPEACTLLRTGEIERWLGALNAAALERTARDARSRAGNDMNIALEAFLDAADPTRTKPMLSVQTTLLDFGAVKRGDVKTLNLVIANSGRGYLHGTASADPPAWLTVTPLSFGCLAGAQQPLQVEVKTAALTGDAAGAPYSGRVVVQSNRGRQTVNVRLAVVEAPELKLSAGTLDFGKVEYGANARLPLEISNHGGGLLRTGVRVADDWLLLVDAAGRPLGQAQETLPDLAHGHTVTVYLALDPRWLQRRGRFAATLQIEALPGRTLLATAPVSVSVEPPYRLDPAVATTGVSTPEQLWRWCDDHWAAALQHLASGRLEACLAFLGEAKLAQAAAQARGHADAAVGLELLLRACGAPPPQDWQSNDGEVVGQLGYGILPRLFGRANAVTLRIANQSKRGYLHGQVTAQTPWLAVPAPAFGCLPGQVAEVELRVDHKAQRWSLNFNETLCEIVVT